METKGVFGRRKAVILMKIIQLRSDERTDGCKIVSHVEEVENVDIIPAIRTDHSAITMHINGIEETGRGPSLWKFNSSLLEEDEYITLITKK